MKKRLVSGMSLAVLAALVLSIGCAKKEEAPPEPVKTEAEITAEKEAERRERETSAIGERASELRSSAAALASQLASAALPGELGESGGGLRQRADEVEKLLGELRVAKKDAWNDTKSRLDKALGDLDAVRASAAAALTEWQAKAEAAMAARESGSVIDWKTGLIQGLDGGDYEQYRPGVVERIQGQLRARGLYAGPVDGTFDKPTLDAVAAYQKSAGLPATGVPSPITRERLFAG